MPYYIAAALILTLAFASVAYITLRRPIARPIPFKDFPVQFADADGWRLRYHQSGRGPHLLLLHGIGANLYCWRHVIPHLTAHFTVTALDLPGFGQSSILPGADYGLDDQIPRVRAFLDRLKIQTTFVVGNSMGGNIALWLALQHPSRVSGVAVIAPATSRKLIPLPLQSWAWVAKPTSRLLTRGAMAWAHRRTVSKKDLVDADRVEETFKTYGGQDQAIKSFLLATAAIRDPRLLTALGRLRTKVLVLWGSKDKLVNRQVIDDLEAALPKAESRIHIGGGHHLQEDEPDWVSEKLVEFFLRDQD